MLNRPGWNQAPRNGMPQSPLRGAAPPNPQQPQQQRGHAPPPMYPHYNYPSPQSSGTRGFIFKLLLSTFNRFQNYISEKFHFYKKSKTRYQAHQVRMARPSNSSVGYIPSIWTISPPRPHPRPITWWISNMVFRLRHPHHPHRAPHHNPSNSQQVN